MPLQIISNIFSLFAQYTHCLVRHMHLNDKTGCSESNSSHVIITHPQFFLPLRCHETFLGLLGFGRLLEALAHFRALAVDFCLLGPLRLKYELFPEIITSCGSCSTVCAGGGKLGNIGFLFYLTNTVSHYMDWSYLAQKIPSKHFIERRIKWTGRRGKGSKQLLEDLKAAFLKLFSSGDHFH